MYILKKIKKGERYDYHHPSTNMSTGSLLADSDLYQVREMEGNSCWATHEYPADSKTLEFIEGYYGKRLLWAKKIQTILRRRKQ